MQTKLFIGIRVTPDLKIRLGDLSAKGLQLIPFGGKEYIGAYIESPFPTVQELRCQGGQFIESLQKHLPDLRTDTLPIVVFPQAFLG
jgi:hypothetical protein